MIVVAKCLPILMWCNAILLTVCVCVFYPFTLLPFYLLPSQLVWVRVSRDPYPLSSLDLKRQHDLGKFKDHTSDSV